jgi:coenzyme PQQ precursor peptide PqqA
MGRLAASKVRCNTMTRATFERRAADLKEGDTSASPKGEEEKRNISCRSLGFGRTLGVLATRSTRACCVIRDLAQETAMAWTTPTLIEICIGLEINGYLPAEF